MQELNEVRSNHSLDVVTIFTCIDSSALTLNWAESNQLLKHTICSVYLVVEEKQSTEKAVQVRCKQGEVYCCRTGFLYDHRHKAVEAKHTGTKAHIQQPWEKKEPERELSYLLQPVKKVVDICCEKKRD